MNRIFAALLCVSLLSGSELLGQEASGLPHGALARVGTFQLRHLASIHQLSILPDGSVAALDVQGNFRVWDPTTGRERRSFSPLSDHYARSDEQLLRYQVNLVHVGAGLQRMVVRSRAPERIMSPADEAFSGDARHLAVLEGDKVTVRDTTIGKVWREFALRLPNPAVEVPRMASNALHRSVAFSSDGRFLAAVPSVYGTTVQVFDLAAGKEVHVLRLPERHPAARLDFLPGRTHLAGVTAEQVLIWDLRTGKRIRSYMGGLNLNNANLNITAFASSADGKRLATAFNDGSITFWENGSEEEADRITREEIVIHSLHFSHDGKTLLAGCADNHIRLFDLAANKESGKLTGHEAPVSALAQSADGKTAASADSRGRIRVWDLAMGKEAVQFGPSVPIVFAAAVTPGIAVLGGIDGSVQHVELPSGKVVRRFKAPNGDPGVLVFSPDGKIVAIIGNNARLWDVEASKEIRTFKGLAAVSALAFSPDGQRFAVIQGEEAALELWDLARGEMQAQFGQHTEIVGFARDGRTLLARRATGELSVVELATGKVRLEIPGAAQVATCFAVAPDSRQLATGGDDIIRMWCLATGKVKQVLAGQTDEVTALAYSREGKRLATGGGDRSVRVWDLAKGHIVQVFVGHRGQVRCLAFSPDGKLLISGSNDGTALIWDLETPLLEPVNADQQAVRFEALWERLTSDKAEAGFAVQNALLEQPGPAADFLGKKLRPAAPAAPGRLNALIAGLSDRRFAAREAATADLVMLGGQAEAALKKTLEAKPELEVRIRVEQLLKQCRKPASGIDGLRLVRAVEVLERVGTPEARKLLEGLAAGAAGARLTVEARGALARLAPGSK